jgi:DNA-binding XRE family transcriptional regulator
MKSEQSIHELREAAGITCAELAAAAGISKSLAAMADRNMRLGPKSHAAVMKALEAALAEKAATVAKARKVTKQAVAATEAA